MKWSHFYMMTFWSESSRVIIVANKKMSISQHCLNTFTSKQKVYLNDSDSRKNVMMIAIRINWELNKRLRKLTLVITHHEKLKELIVRMKHLADVATENQECHGKIYKVYSDNQTSLKTVKVDINKRSNTSATSSDYAWEHSILRSHAEVTLSDETCRSTWKWSDEQDNWRCI